MLWLPLLLTFFGVVSLWGPVSIGAADAPEWLIWSLLGAAVLASWTLWFREPERKALLIALAQTTVACACLFWATQLAAYENPRGMPAFAGTAPDVGATRVVDGAEFRLSAQRDKRLLLVFFRGAW